ncbi:MAG: hypothetical protein KAS29_17705, partial [Bacteroidales bacterium]|nr:hypothetical protein [Bacteroidales bacterium]
MKTNLKVLISNRECDSLEGKISKGFQVIVLACIVFLMTATSVYAQGENWRKVTEQPTPRHDIGSCVVDGKIYSIGGMSHGYNPGSQTFFSMVTVFDPETGVWETCQSLPGPRVGLFACAINGKIYAFGGRRNFGSGNLTVVEIYDIEKDEWTTGTSMPKGAAFAAGCVLDGRIYIMGGLQENGWMASKQLLRYNPVEDSWETLAEMNVAQSLFSANVVNG